MPTSGIKTSASVFTKSSVIGIKTKCPPRALRPKKYLFYQASTANVLKTKCPPRALRLYNFFRDTYPCWYGIKNKMPTSGIKTPVQNLLLRIR